MEFLFGVRETFEVGRGDGRTIVNVLKTLLSRSAGLL